MNLLLKANSNKINSIIMNNPMTVGINKIKTLIGIQELNQIFFVENKNMPPLKTKSALRMSNYKKTILREAIYTNRIIN